MVMLAVTPPSATSPPSPPSHRLQARTPKTASLEAGADVTHARNADGSHDADANEMLAAQGERNPGGRQLPSIDSRWWRSCW